MAMLVKIGQLDRVVFVYPTRPIRQAISLVWSGEIISQQTGSQTLSVSVLVPMLCFDL